MSGNIRHICIIGNGPNSLLATKLLLDKGLHVTIVDSDEDFSKSSTLLHKLVLKNRINKRDLYLQGIPLRNHSQSEISPVETKKSGGLTNFWGGVFFPPYLDFYARTIGLKESDFDKVLDCFSGEISLRPTEAQYWNSSLNVSDNKKGSWILELAPQIACNSDGSIWNVSKLWEKMKHERLEVISGTVIRIVAQPEKLVLKIRKNETNIEISCEQLFLAGGPIGNAKLLLNSVEKAGKLRILDSGVTYHLTLHWKSKKALPHDMRAVRCGFVFRKNRLASYYQHYDFSEELLNSLKYAFLRKTATRCNKLLGNRLGLLMFFQNDEDSPSIEISRVLESFKVNPHGRRKLGTLIYGLTKLTKTFFKKRILITPMFLLGKAGDGSHSAGPRQDELEVFIKDDYFGQEIGRRVHLLGMSRAQRVFAGPVTYLSLVLTKDLVDGLFVDDE